MTRPAAVLCTLVLVLTAGCSGDDDSATPRGTTSASTSTSASASESGAQSPTPEDTAVLSAKVAGVVTGGLAAPWALAFLPDGSALVSERDTARIKRVSPDGDVTRVGTVDGVQASGEGGLLGIALSPSYQSDHLLFAYFTAATRTGSPG